MREIKFRAWCNHERKMTYYDFMEVEESNRGLICYGDALCVDEIMQYTELTDKNNKEIYEGDIVDTRYGRFVVRYDKQLAGYYPFASPNNALDCETESEIIGNIYENPELIK